MRQKYILLILLFCGVTITGELLKVARMTNGFVPGGSERTEFTTAMDNFIHPAPKDDSPYYESGGIIRPTPAPTMSTDESLVKAKVDECQNQFQWPALTVFTNKITESMAITNARSTPLIMQMMPPQLHGRGRWTIAPHATWKTATRVGQRWLVAATGDRCLFYVTAGDEPLKMVVNSQ